MKREKERRGLKEHAHTQTVCTADEEGGEAVVSSEQREREKEKRQRRDTMTFQNVLPV